MAARLLLSPRRQRLARSPFFLALALFVPVLSLSAPPIGGRCIHVSSTPIERTFPTSGATGTRRSRALVLIGVSPSSSNQKIRPVHSPKRLVFALLSKITRKLTKLRRSFLRATAILSFILFGVTMMAPTRPASARPGRSSATVELSSAAPESSSAAAKCVKAVLTAGGVAAGVSVARSLDGNGGDDGPVTAPGESDHVPNVVPKAEPSPLPLSSEWIQQELKDAEKEGSQPPAATPAAGDGNRDPALVKDLDAKIAMLRAREEAARAVEEERRARDREEAQERRRRDRAETDARIAAAAREEAAVAAAAAKKKAKREREDERERQLGALERGKREQARLELKQQRRSGVGGDAASGDARAVDIEEERRQPRPVEEERKLKEKYGAIDDVGERAYSILVDLGMVEVHPDITSTSLDWDEEEDESMNVFM